MTKNKNPKPLLPRPDYFIIDSDRIRRRIDELIKQGLAPNREQAWRMAIIEESGKALDNEGTSPIDK